MGGLGGGGDGGEGVDAECRVAGVEAGDPDELVARRIGFSGGCVSSFGADNDDEKEEEEEQGFPIRHFHFHLREREKEIFLFFFLEE